MSGSQTAIITGASGGVGSGLVEAFLREGYKVVATSREATRKLTALGTLVQVDGDIGKQQTAAYAVEAAINNFGTIDEGCCRCRALPGTGRSCERRDTPRGWCRSGSSLVAARLVPTSYLRGGTSQLFASDLLGR